jgi:hypothetical protein
MKQLFTYCCLLVTFCLKAQTSYVPGVPYFYQYNNNINPGGSCQNTSIAMVIKFYGGASETPDAISGIYGTSQAQSPGGLKQVFDAEAVYFGLPVRDVAHTNGTFAGLHAILAAGKPVIVHGYFTGYGHVLVVTGYNGTTYTCNDPAGQWNQIYQGGGYSQSNSTQGHNVTYGKTAFQNAIGPDGTIWYHEIINTPTITPTPSTVDITPPTSVANIVNPTAYKTSNFTVNFADADNSGGSGLDKSFYTVLDWNGFEWRGNQNNGFMCDNFDVGLHPDWSSTSGTWNVSSNLLNQTNNVNINTSLSTTLNQNLSNRYIYHWLGNISGSGTNRNAGIHIMCDSVNKPNRGNNYLIWFKADAGEVHIYKVINDIISSPIKVFTGVTINTNTWYDHKVMYDRTTGKFTIWLNDDLVGTYTDSSPLTTGKGFSFRTRECIYKINNLKAYRTRPVASAIVSVGNINSDVRYQSPDPSSVSYSCKIKNLCVDNMANISSIGDLNVLIDWTAPSAPTVVNDGVGSDISVTTSTNSINANFTMCTDLNSAIKRYHYFIGTAPNDSSIVGSTNNLLNTSITKTGLNLVNGTTYYVSVYSVNNAGLKSAVTSSNGQLVNSSVTGLNESIIEGNFSVYPNPNYGLFTLLVNNNNNAYTIQITNVLGEIVDSRKITSVKTEFANQLVAGVYVVTLLNNNQTIATKKIIVN